jgi:hypothetical protein
MSTRRLDGSFTALRVPPPHVGGYGAAPQSTYAMILWTTSPATSVNRKFLPLYL